VILNATSGPQARRHSASVQGDPPAAFRFDKIFRSLSCCRAAPPGALRSRNSDTERPFSQSYEPQPADRLESAADVHIASDLYVRLDSEIALTSRTASAADD